MLPYERKLISMKVDFYSSLLTNNLQAHTDYVNVKIVDCPGEKNQKQIKQLLFFPDF